MNYKFNSLSQILPLLNIKECQNIKILNNPYTKYDTDNKLVERNNKLFF